MGGRVQNLSEIDAEKENKRRGRERTRPGLDGISDFLSSLGTLSWLACLLLGKSWAWQASDMSPFGAEQEDDHLGAKTKA